MIISVIAIPQYREHSYQLLSCGTLIYGLSREEKYSGQCLFTEIKHCWMLSPDNWMGDHVGMPRVVFFGKSGWHSAHQWGFPPLRSLCVGFKIGHSWAWLRLLDIS